MPLPAAVNTGIGAKREGPDNSLRRARIIALEQTA
jgi:hypothetical protein